MGKMANFFTAAMLKLVLVNVAGGGLFGYIIGFVAVYNVLDNESRDCHRLKSQEACSSISHSASCVWSMPKKECQFKDTNDAGSYQCADSKEEGACKNLKHCHWDYGDDVCAHKVGMNALETGIYAGAMTLGGMFGSFTAGPVAHKIGRKWSICIAGFIGLIGAIVIHIARASDKYALHIVGRFLNGIASGGACVLSPMYVEEMAPADMKGPIGTTFQAAITTGIMIAGLLGFLIEPRNTKAKQSLEVRIQAFSIITSLLAALYMFVGFISEESKKYIQLKAAEEHGDNMNAEEEDPELRMDDARYKMSEMIAPLLIATFMCLALQFSGINAIMNYAPKMMSQLKIESLLGNFLIMLWNCVTSFAAIPISSKVPLRKMFVTAIGIAAVALIIVGIPTYPNVTSSNVRRGLGVFGIFAYILVFEIGLGPPFYILCMQLFPYSFRPKGSASTNGIVFVFNLIINIFYPICVRDFSGGESGDQNKGMAICFFFFAVCASVSFIVTLKWLFPFYDSPKGKLAMEECAARRAAAQKDANRNAQDENDAAEAVPGEERPE